MRLADWARRTNESAAPLTVETLDKAMAQVLKRGAEPRHDCRFDGHVEVFMGRRCVYCGEVVRELTVDENHIRHGEFF